MNRSQPRILEIGRRKIERRLFKIKKHMNKLYLEAMACEQALEYFKKLAPEEVKQAVDKEQELRTEIVEEIAKLEDASQPTTKVPHDSL